MSAEQRLRTQIVIAGGGPVGLAAATELSHRGVQCLVVEPRRQVSHARPRCKTVNVRTMEHLRRWGLAEDLRARAPLPVSWSQDVVFCTSLTGWELSRFTGVLGLTADGDRFAELGQQAPQYVLEELLRDHLQTQPTCTTLLGSRVVDVVQDQHEVHVSLSDEDGAQTTVTADFLLGCDGPRSVVRERIGSDYTGEHALRPNFGMVFTAPQLWSQVAHGPAVHYWVVNRSAPALMGPLDRDGTWWIIAFGVDRQTGEREGPRLIDAAVGRPVDATIQSVDPWTARMQIVDRMREGRVFLAGDAAHLNPPFGGHGLNTGIGDAVDLGWKLAAVLDGWAGPGLLDSYEAERRPIQERVIREATTNMSVTSPELMADHLEEESPAGAAARQLANVRIQQTKDAEFHALDLVLDVDVATSAVICPRDDSPGREPPSGEPAGAVPGHRLPHMWLAQGQSVFDAIGPALSLVRTADADHAPLRDAARERGIPLTDVDLRGLGLRPRYGANLLLVRPDHYVAWAGDRPPLDPGAVLDTVTGRATSSTAAGHG